MTKRTIIVDGELGPMGYTVETAAEAASLMKQALSDGFIKVPKNSGFSSIAPKPVSGQTTSDRFIPTGRLISIS